MPTSKTWNGTTYAIPAAGEINWSALSTFLIDLATNAGIVNQARQAIRVPVATPITVAAATDYAVLSNLTVPGAVAMNLPAGVTGQIFVLGDAKGDAATNNITITPAGAETIGGAATLILNHNYQTVIIQWLSNDWKVLANLLKPGTIVDADIAAAGGIARSKIASGTAYRVVTNGAAGALQETSLTANYPVIADANGLPTTEQYLDKTRGGTGITSTATFPSSGTVTTNAGTQQLTNKDIDGGTASDTSRVTVPKAAKATLEGLTRKEGTVVYDTDSDSLFVDDGSVLKQVGSGAGQGEVNYCLKSTFEDQSYTGWWKYTDAGATPTDGQSAGNLAANLTLTVVSDTFAGSAKALQIANSGASSQGQGVSYSDITDNTTGFLLAEVDRSRQLKIQFDYDTTSFVAGDIVCYIYDVTNAAIITPTITSLPAGTGRLGMEFASTTGSNYRLIFHSATTNVNWSLRIDNVIVGPDQLVVGPVVGGWTAFTPGYTNYGSKTPTGGRNNGYWRRVGDVMEMEWATQFDSIASGGGADQLLLAIPSGLSIDFTKLASITGWDAEELGTFHTYGISALGTIQTGNSVSTDAAIGNYVRFLHQTAYITKNTINNTNQVYISGRASIPISEWSTNAYYGAESVEFSSNSNSNAATADDTTSFVYGQSGSLLISATPAGIGITRTVRFQRKIQPSDLIILEISNDKNYWTTVPADPASPGGIDSMRYDGTNYIGAGGFLVSTNGTDVSLRFGKYRSGVTSAWTGTGYWRVKKVSSPGLAGHKIASQTEVGLIGAKHTELATASDTSYTSAAPRADSALVTTTVPKTSYYTIIGKATFRSAASDGVYCTAILRIKTGSATYGSATERDFTNTTPRAPAAVCGSSTDMVMYHGSLNAGDSIHLGSEATTSSGTAYIQNIKMLIQETDE